MAPHYIQRQLSAPEESYFLLGPRGTGRSTWLIHRYPHATQIDLLLGEEERRFSSYPNPIRSAFGGHRPNLRLTLLFMVPEVFGQSKSNAQLT